MAPADQPVHFLDRVHRSANGAVAVGIVLEVRLEDWFQHELGGGLDHPIPDRWNAERSLASVRLAERQRKLREASRSKSRREPYEIGRDEIATVGTASATLSV